MTNEEIDKFWIEFVSDANFPSLESVKRLVAQAREAIILDARVKDLKINLKAAYRSAERRFNPYQEWND